jgi:hypothetical protein
VCCATDCAFHNLKDVVAEIMNHRSPTSVISRVPLLKSVILESICFANEVIYGYRLEDVGPRNCLHKVKLPLLTIHSELDEVSLLVWLQCCLFVVWYAAIRNVVVVAEFVGLAIHGTRLVWFGVGYGWVGLGWVGVG